MIRSKKIALFLIGLLLISFVLGGKTYEAESMDYKHIAWITTVYNRDFPHVKNNPRAQKIEFLNIIEELEEIGITDIVFQVRPKSDAFYKSKINPWSDILTGQQGKDPGYDPLEFIIEESHKRGIRVHAWLNPYRVTTSGTNLESLSPKHFARKNPHLLIKHKISNGGEALCYNPALDEVKDHINDTVYEIISNYDVDGIHFDDYFYPSNYPLPKGEDRDGQLANQRREDVNDMVRSVSKTIKNYDSSIEFGISPAGIWKNKKSDSRGSDTNGRESYYDIYSDSVKWIEEAWIDYIVPQIYWERGHSHADYETLVSWWNKQVEGSKVDLYIGQGIYKDEVASEILDQLIINNSYNNIRGSFYYSLRELRDDKNEVKKAILDFKNYNNVNDEENIIFGDTSMLKR